MKLFYGSTALLMPEGFLFRNARFFESVLPDAKEVVIDGSYPEIEEAYRGADVPVSRIDKVAPAFVPAPGSGVETVGPIPADWRDLPWTQPEGANGLTMRGLAAEVSESPIRSKADAIEAIEAYLAGDLDKPLPEADGLTRRELNASLEGLDLEIIPDEDAAETFQRIEGARASRDVAADLARDPD